MDAPVQQFADAREQTPPGSLRRTWESRLHTLSNGAHTLAELCQAGLDSRATSLHCCQTPTRQAPPGQDLQMVVA